jgi:N-acetylglutamate synthase-like GNAT family acetyltransferase
MSTQYTKADLERIVMAQLENLSAIHDLLSIMKVQNELLHNANKKLKDETADFKTKQYQHSARGRK